MDRRRVFLSLSIAAVTAGTGSVLSASHPTVNPVESLASKVMAKLIAGDPVAAVAGIHEPRAWDVPHASADRHKVSEDLGVLLKEFGKNLWSARGGGRGVLRAAGGRSRRSLLAVSAERWNRLAHHLSCELFKSGSGSRRARVHKGLGLLGASLRLSGPGPEPPGIDGSYGANRKDFLRTVAPRMSKDEVESALAQIVGQRPI